VSARPKFVVGLGNPGSEYAATRHNMGFVVLDRLAKELNCSFRRKWRFSAEVAEAVASGGSKVYLAKPRTYMNRSGVAVGALLRWLKLEPAEMLVVVDDADLPLGQVRLRASGGSGGHNGLRSIIETLGGNEAFARLRVGIGRPAAGAGSSDAERGADMTDHVLSRFATAEQAAAEQASATAVEAIQCCLREGLAEAMNQFNRRKPGP
jgi:PTH1 family peptidyl-tRNA hydrolase